MRIPSKAAVQKIFAEVSKVPRLCENSHIDNFAAVIDHQTSGIHL